jgi:hypothetical protein
MCQDAPRIELATSELLKPLHRPFVEHFASCYRRDPMLFAFHSGSIALLVIHELETQCRVYISNDEAIVVLKLAIERLNGTGHGDA